MGSKIVIALLAALPLSVAHAVQAPQYKEIQLRQVTSTLGFSAAATTSFADIYTQCLPPSSLFESPPTNSPTLPSAIESFFETVSITDPCATLSIPQSLSSDYVSYTSALVSWEKANGPALSSQAAALSSYEASVSANPVCMSLLSSYSTYSSAFVTPTTGLGVCTSSHSGAATATGSSSGSGSGNSSKNSASNNPAASRETTMLLVGSLLAGCVAAVVFL